MSRTSRILTAVSGVALLFVANNAAQAAVVNLQTLYVNEISGTISASGTTYPFDQTLSPPGELDMGSYAGNIANYTSGTTYVSVDSNSTYGGNVLSGTADTTGGTLSLDLSSLSVNAGDTTYGVTIDGPLWSASSTITQDSYNPVTGAFIYGWSDTIDATTSLGTVPVAYTATMQGNATVVPLPATAPMMLTGVLLLGWYGIRRNRA